MKKIGIFSGTFDPVHGGHIAFALDAIQAAGLAKVYFLPEARPRRKQGVTHYAHRLAMLKLALKPYAKLDVLELPDKQFSVVRTLPRIKKKLPGSQLYLLIGSDTLEFLNTGQWPDTELLLEQARLIVGVRSSHDIAMSRQALEGMSHEGLVVEAAKPGASSRDIRRAVGQGKNHPDALKVLNGYIKQNWLYAKVPNEKR